ncbi:MAG: MBL fold metallo-hydrolase [Prolixibacteraceae bacterium]|nr:MBL fold metallo-hydrolase [Prolixibacteraceae bacterium]
MYLIRFFLCVVCVSISVLSIAQDQKEQPTLASRDKIETLLFKQAAIMFDLIDHTLKEYPPEIGQPIVRKHALYNLDALFHETRYDQSPELHQFMAKRIAVALADLSHPLEDGMKIYKLYNHGFVVRTPTVTVAFDLYTGKGLIADSLMQAIVDKCDILFVTHFHKDHADKQVAEMFIKATKPIWAPTNLWEDNAQVQHIRCDKLTEREIKIKNSLLKVTILPGNQGQVMNNIYEITTPEGFNVIHTGDQHSEKDMEWLSKIGRQIPAPDVLIVNCWTKNLSVFLNDFNPKLVITGHENELGHSIDHREPYWLSFQKLEQINKPYVLMTWGEYYKIP